MNDTAQILEAAADAAGYAAAVPGPMGVAARIVSLALRAGSAIVRAGGDPVIEIRRLLASQPLLDPVRAEWNEALKRTFPDGPVPEAPDTVPAGPSSGEGDDIYGDQ